MTAQTQTILAVCAESFGCDPTKIASPSRLPPVRAARSAAAWIMWDLLKWDVHTIAIELGCRSQAVRQRIKVVDLNWPSHHELWPKLQRAWSECKKRLGVDTVVYMRQREAP